MPLLIQRLPFSIRRRPLPGRKKPCAPRTFGGHSPVWRHAATRRRDHRGYLRGTSPERTYYADLAQAGAVRPGDDVRIAGIPVGSVKSLTLLPDRVRMQFTVTEKAFVGDQTTLDIRMLTVVGGYYVAVEPSGTAPLGRTVIPQERVILPYNLTQAFQDAAQPVHKIDGGTLRQDLDAVAASVGTSPDSVRTAVRAADDIVGVLNSRIPTSRAPYRWPTSTCPPSTRTPTCCSACLPPSEPWKAWSRPTRCRSHSLSTTWPRCCTSSRRWDESADDTLKQRAQPLADAVPKLQELGNRLGTLLDSLRALEQKLLPLLPSGGGVNIDQSAASLRAAVCVPVPGGGC